MKSQLLLIRTSLLFIFIALTAMSVLAQANAVQPLVTQPVDLHNLVTLHGNVHPLARPEYDQGVAPDDLPMERMLLVLRRGADQETALRKLLDDQQVASSPQFHHWLTPVQFGQQFGPTDSELQAVTSWLTSQGFQVANVSTGRTVVEFSGSAGLVRQVLGAEIHRFRVNGNDYWANTSDPQIPAALAPVVAGFASLNNFPRPSSTHIVDVFSRSSQTGVTHPLFTVPTSSTTNVYGVSPYDFATIYNVLPLWNAGIDGTGQTIAIVGQSNINYGDVESFQILFGLPVHNINAILNGPDPGIVKGDETEALLDVEWSGAVAKGATIDLVVSQTTQTTQGVDLSAVYIVDNDIAPVMSESYGDCELDLGVGGNAFQYSVREQGAAEGITIINSSGDSGSARCDQGQSEYAAASGLSVSGLASTPFNVAVGGTDFADNNIWASYWNSTNTSTYASAKSYIPETTWNASCAASGLASKCANASADSPMGIDIVAAGGGPSTCGVWTGTGTSAACSKGYPKPAWQTGAGVPNDGVRDIPDVSLFASTGTNGSFYVLCEGDAVQGNPSCTGGTNWYFIGVGGTSAAAPSFAAIMALVNQKTGQRQGNANYVLYPLAAESGSTCTSNEVVITNANCIFYDIVSGNNSVACSGGSQNCSNHTSGSYGLLVDPANNSNPAWSTGSGYDRATGLGSVNAANLVNKWNSITFQTTTTTLSAFPSTITHGQPANFTVSVTSGSGTPTGDVSLIAQISSTQNLGVGSYTLASDGTVSSSNNVLPGGSYSVFARYAGDGTRGTSDSAPHAITVNKESSKTNVTVSSCDYTSGACNPGVTSGVYGSFYTTLLANVTNAGGQPCASASGSVNYLCPSGMLGLTVDSGFVPLNTASFRLDNQGDVKYSHIDLPGGTYNLMANYAGDNNYSESVSPNVPVSITKAPTTTTLTGMPATIIYNNFTPTSLPTVRVDTTSHGAEPSFAIQYLDNGTLLPSTGGGMGGGANGSSTTYAYLQQSTAPAFPPGPSTIAAVFSGDSNYSGSTSPTVNVTVTDFSLSSNTNSVNIPAAGQTGTALITVTPLYGFTGTVNLVINDGCIDYMTCTVSPSSVTMSGSTPATATLSIVTYANSGPRFQKPQSRIPPAIRPHLPWPWILAVLLLLTVIVVFKWVDQPARWILVAGLAMAALWVACGGGSSGGGYNYTPPPSGTISFSPGRSISFSGQKVYTTSAPQTLTVSNTGQATLDITGVTLNGTNAGDFSMTNACGRVLAASANCTISVTFTPNGQGNRAAGIVVNNNTIEPAPTITLSGLGTVPAIAFTPPSLTFGPQKLQTTSPSQSMTLTNTGAASMNLVGVGINGRNFSETNNCPWTIAVGDGCTINVKFTPLDVGAIEDEVQVNADVDYNETLAKLDGTGAPPTTAAGNYSIRVRATIGYDWHDIVIPVTVQ
jgi:hypothetical protein